MGRNYASAAKAAWEESDCFMTASDLHQRMLHLLDRARAMSGPDAHGRPKPAPTRDLGPVEAMPLDWEPDWHNTVPDLMTPDLAANAALPPEPPGEEPGPAAVPQDAGQLRRESRHKVLRKGKITYSNGNFEVECQVRDLNSTGARLKLAGDVTVPSCFQITIYPEKLTRSAQVCWRNDLVIGIRFLDD